MEKREKKPSEALRMTDVKLKQDDIVEAEIVDNGMAGEGIAKVGAYTLFVPLCIAGETVRAKVTHVRKDNVVFCELKEVIKPSADRVKPPCNRFGKCGGCDLMHVGYSKQLEIKRNNLVRLLKKNASVDIAVPEIVPCSTPYGYRNKIQLPFGTVEGRTALGFYRENTHRVVSITKCFLHGEWAEKLIKIFLDYAAKFNLKAYDENTGKGQLKHLVARYIDGNLAVVVVTDNSPLKAADYLVSELKKEFPHFSLYQSKKPERTNVIMGKSVIPIKTEQFYVDVLGVKAEINPYSFLQLNSEIRDKIYSRVIDEITEKPNPVVIDAYAGVGLLGAVLSKRGARVYNIEIVPEATADGEKLKRENDLTASYVNGDAKIELPKIIQKLSATDILNKETLNIILDPPRKGCDRSVLEAINALNVPHKVIYISCNPATLTRDLTVLQNYEIEFIQGYDMFPNTAHLETLVIMSKLL